MAGPQPWHNNFGINHTLERCVYFYTINCLLIDLATYDLEISALSNVISSNAMLILSYDWFKSGKNSWLR